MSNQSDHTIVRLRVPPELKKQIEESAEKNNRSQSAEMVARLEQSFSLNQPIPNLSELIAKQEEAISYMKELHQENRELRKQLEKNTKIVEDELRSSYLEYAMSVLTSQAPPESRSNLNHNNTKESNSNWQKLNPNTNKKAP